MCVLDGPPAMQPSPNLPARALAPVLQPPAGVFVQYVLYSVFQSLAAHFHSFSVFKRTFFVMKAGFI